MQQDVLDKLIVRRQTLLIICITSMKSFVLTVSAICVHCAVFCAPAAASDELLNGVWMETANYPAASVIRFEKSGESLVGKYRQVSAPQRHWGFEVGEAVIRGKMEGDVFSGEVLLKLHKDILAMCPDLRGGWVPIELMLVEPGKLYGRWRQTHFSENEPCKPIGYTWQLYGLEKLEVP